MKQDNNGAENSARFWSDFEGELSVYYHFMWDSADMSAGTLSFIRDYVMIAEKYKIAVPINALNSLDIKPVTLYSLYQVGVNYYYPTYLFINSNDAIAQGIISIDPLLSIENSSDKLNSHGSIPVRIELLLRENKLKLLCYLDNDIFNLELDNKKCKNIDFFVDNSELAYLNTPRLNSFLRDLKKLCFAYGATGFEFENLGLNDFCEDGVMFNGEVIYYEDVVDLLLPEHRIVK
jgi:hypothetical protein